MNEKEFYQHGSIVEFNESAEKGFGPTQGKAEGAAIPEEFRMLAKEEGIKFDGGKPRLDLIPPEVIFALGDILEYGSKKYGDRNWEKGMEKDRVFGAAMRHLWAYWGGEYTDEESGRPHLYSALANISFLITYHERGLITDTGVKEKS